MNGLTPAAEAAARAATRSTGGIAVVYVDDGYRAELLTKAVAAQMLRRMAHGELARALYGPLQPSDNHVLLVAGDHVKLARLSGTKS